MNRYFWLLLIALYCRCCAAQLNDNFNDGDYTNNPTWIGSRQHFIINNEGQLQLQANEAGGAHLCLPTQYNSSVLEWQFYIELDFSPSNNNFARVYLLISNVDTLHQQSDGVYLQFGENGSNDAIELFSCKNGVSNSICRGIDGEFAEPFQRWIKVKYTQGLWEIYVAEIEQVYNLETVGNYNIDIPQHGIGVFCQYTSSNTDRFYFDDFYYGPIVVDTIPPRVLGIEVAENLQQLHVQFSEPLDFASSHLLENYCIDGHLYPNSASFYQDNVTAISLYFDSPFQEDSLYIIQIKDIKDLNDNILVEYNGDFKKWEIQKYDVIISEIMAKPTPSVLLPFCEYVELYNANAYDSVELEGWVLQTGNTTRELPNVVIPPNEYVCLVAENCSEFQGQNYNCCFLPSLAITDGGQQLWLMNEKGEIIHDIFFSSSWHTEDLKEEGGWSLEMIDLRYPCAGKENWASSSSPSGGTPGASNSCCGEEVQLPPFQLEKVVVDDSISIHLFFNYPIFINAEISLNDVFSLSNNLTIDTICHKTLDCKTITMKLSTPIGGGVYRVSVKDIQYISTCGNIATTSLENISLQFGLPNYPEKQDIVINEVLANPLGTTSARYVEIYNRSKKIIDLKNVKIGVGGEHFPEKVSAVISSGYQLFPQSYVAICKDAETTNEQYYIPDKRNLIYCDSMPTFASSEGIIYLLDRSLKIIDRFYYQEEMHYSLLSSTDGVSLERVHPDRATQEANNWKSAAASVGYGTPAAQNSQYSANNTEEEFQIIPKVFSPDGDAFDDYTEIFYKTQEVEERITIKIYTLNGELVRCLANNQLAATQERFMWDGLTDSKTLVPNGMYVVKLQTWSLSGKGKTMKRVVAVYLND